MASNEQTCGTCRYFALGVSPLGACMLNPPTVTYDVAAGNVRSDYPTVTLTTPKCYRWTPNVEFFKSP